MRRHPSPGGRAVGVRGGERDHRTGKLGHLARQRAEAVPRRDHAVGHARCEVEHRDREQVAGLGAAHGDRSGDDVRAVVGEGVRHARPGALLRVVEHVGAADAVAGEELARVAALVLEHALVTERVDRDDRARRHRCNGCVGLAGQPSP